MAKYRDYTAPDGIAPASRKRESYDTCREHGERAMLQQNDRRNNPIGHGTLRTWVSHMKYVGIWKP